MPTQGNEATVARLDTTTLSISLAVLYVIATGIQSCRNSLISSVLLLLFALHSLKAHLLLVFYMHKSSLAMEPTL